MTSSVIRYIILFIVFVLAQALVLGHIHLFDCATPLLYVYFALLIPRNFPRWLTLTLCFLLGLSIDSFFNTPGVGSAAMTLVGFIQPYILMLFLDREDADDFTPALNTMGWAKFLSYSFILVFIFMLVFFSLEAFNFFNWLQWLMCIGGSFGITMLLIVTIDSVRQ